MAATDFLFEQVHPASLAITRILFGFLMLFDIPDERGGAEIDIRWGDPKSCNFPLFSFMPRPSFPWICIMYGVMWIGALGICIGYKFRASCACYIVPYWYILLLDKSFWNNHSYLYGLLAILLTTTNAGDFWSLDYYFSKNEKMAKQNGVPFWNYFMLKFQVFCLYFFAGLKKLDMEWLEGYSMTNMGKHWVFNPFGLLLTTEQIDYFIIHLVGFLLDLTVGFFLLYGKTRPWAYLFCGMFHLMNSRLFSIGMFPYVCLATMHLFSCPDWPVKLHKYMKYGRRGNENPIAMSTDNPSVFTSISNNKAGIADNSTTIEGKHPALIGTTKDKKIETRPIPITQKRKRTVFLMMIYCFLQIFLPWSHFITKGYNNWTNGLYGYSWDMMVHSWDTTLVIVRIVDNNNGQEMFLDPTAWVHNDRWNKHADMSLQYAQCVKNNVKSCKQQKEGMGLKPNMQNADMSDNLSIFVDVWCSLNGRFQQRMFNPHYDLLAANWSPFSKVEWLLPLLIEYSDLREKMKTIQEDVYSWSNYSDVLFVADFPEMQLENFITKDLVNATLTIIEGEVIYQTEDEGKSVLLKQGESVAIASNVFHKIKTVSKIPSCFMYTYENSTKAALNEVNLDTFTAKRSPSPLPILEDREEAIEGFVKMFGFIGNALLHILYDVPMVRRARVE